jgi:[ribosomal protein S5]-alanine N-acetyltransferase
MLTMPVLETERLRVRELVADDLDVVHHILDLEGAAGDAHATVLTRDQRRAWLTWSIESYTQYAMLYQPPLGERAIVRHEDTVLVGIVGFVPCLNRFDLIPGFPNQSADHPALASAEIGMFWALGQAYHGRGYATEAARAMIGYAFGELRLKHIVATTEHANAASIAVMRRLGMRIGRNPGNQPPWLQVVGVLVNPDD